MKLDLFYAQNPVCSKIAIQKLSGKLSYCN